MNKIGKNALAASLAFALGGTASAQGPANTQHDGHHAGAPAGAPQSQGSGMLGAGTAAPGGMMGGDMGRMMQQMMQRRMAAAAMQPFRRIEGQLAFFRAELRLTDAQLPQWNSFGDVVRAQAERLRQATQQGMSDGMGAVPAPQQLERVGHVGRAPHGRPLLRKRRHGKGERAQPLLREMLDGRPGDQAGGSASSDGLLQHESDVARQKRAVIADSEPV